jgi:acyl-coenzyme A synthetase/AMP-(fatty) acid ligase
VFYPSDLHAALAAAPAPRLLVTTPLQLRALLQAALPMAAIAGIISATAPLDPALAAEAEQRWGAPVREIFGATEIGSIASRRTVEGPDWTMLPGIRLAPGASSVHVTATDAPAGVLTDVVELDGPERFRLLGRASDMVKLGGRRASLAGLNRALTDIPGVTDGVFLAPDDLDSRPTARLQAFVIAPDRSPEDILAALRARIDPGFLPRRIVRVKSLPRNELGKLPRDALRVLEQAREDQ